MAIIDLEQTNRILITAALKAELLPIQRSLQNTFPAQQDHIAYLITGVGSGPVTTQLVPYLTHHAVGQVINVGTAGAIGEAVQLFDLFLPTEFYAETGNGLTKLVPELNSDLIRLGTQQAWRMGALWSASSPITTTQQKARLQALNNIAIVDMEAYTIQVICQHRQLPCYCLKVVTDHASEKADDEFCNNLEAALAKLSQAVVRLVEFLLSSQP